MLNPYNDLYDPLMGRSVCVSGQLFLTDLVVGYLEQCETIRIINLNTDGVLFSIDDSELPKVQAVNAEWETRTGFTLEEDKVKKIVQKNVNNYIMVMLDGKVKKKGRLRQLRNRPSRGVEREQRLRHSQESDHRLLRERQACRGNHSDLRQHPRVSVHSKGRREVQSCLPHCEW